MITDALLPADSPIPDEEHPCHRCRLCASVCPVGMIPMREDEQVRIGPVTETIARKRPNSCCWIGCTGYEGLSTDLRWSNYSPYRLESPLPDTKAELDALCNRLQASDPMNQEEDNSFEDYRKAIFDDAWHYYTVCGFCRSVCRKDRPQRVEARRRIISSGCAALAADGNHVRQEEGSLCIATPFGLSVMIHPDELKILASCDQRELNELLSEAKNPLDREVLRYLSTR